MSAIALPGPVAVLLGGAVAVYLVARLLPERNELLAGLSAICLALSLVAELAGREAPALWNARAGLRQIAVTASGDPGALIVPLALLLGIMVAIYGGKYMSRDRRIDRYYPLLLLMLAGTAGTIVEKDLFTLYLYIALSTGASYVLVAFRRDTDTAIEAGFKYAIMASMGSLLMLSGIALVWRGTGTLRLPMAIDARDIWQVLGTALLTSGLLIKSAVFPAHTWLPDAHGRAPSSISALLSGIVVPVQLYTLVRLGLSLGMPRASFGWLLASLGISSMLAGNLLALRQTYGKRLLGYSTIAHLGYMLVAFGLGIAFDSQEAFAVGLLLLISHALLKALAFLAKGTLHYYYDATLLSDLDGLAYRAPLPSGLLVFALLGLAGLPPAPLFIAKLGLLWALPGLSGGAVYAMAGLVMLGSLIGVGYYLPIVGRLLRHPAAPVETQPHANWIQLPMVTLALLAVIIGLWSAPLWHAALQGAQQILAQVPL
ncbi:MAG: proton-conducting transporter membrane subunit [Anaerolineae bacterium]